MMILVAIMGIISAGILSQMNEAQQRGYTEQVKRDNFQEARDFVDQFFRDINQIGYPSSRLVDTTSLTWSPVLMPQATYTWANTYIFDNRIDRKSTRLNSSHQIISYAVFCLKKTNCKR